VKISQLAPLDGTDIWMGGMEIICINDVTWGVCILTRRWKGVPKDKTTQWAVKMPTIIMHYLKQVVKWFPYLTGFLLVHNNLK
jgi:hypothetical protein